jgi:hypothetical protein
MNSAVYTLNVSAERNAGRRVRMNPGGIMLESDVVRDDSDENTMIDSRFVCVCFLF